MSFDGTRREPLAIGGAGGAWGDSALGLGALLDDGRAEVLIYDALAEITMGLLGRARRRDPSAGYATDVIEMVAGEASRIRDRGARVLTNAGGTNPAAAAAALRERAAAAGVTLRVATVSGDEVRGPAGSLGANAYLGAWPLVTALRAGADVVITGRVVDSALTLAPLLAAFGWAPGDYDRLAAGSLAGHLLECGPQASGGLMSDWEDVPGWAEIGAPIAFVGAQGEITIAKAGGGGLVDVRGVTEQLLYEIGDPAAYLLPDVTCDFRGVRVEALGAERVRVMGARGRPPPETLKACAQVPEGFKLAVMMLVAGGRAGARARRLSEAIVARAEAVLRVQGHAALGAHHVELLGAETTFGANAREGARETREVVLRVAFAHEDAAALERVAAELPSFGLVVSGVSGGGVGRARPTPRIRLHTFAVARGEVAPRVELDGEPLAHTEPEPAPPIAPDETPAPPPAAPGDRVRVPLRVIAHARSGDKGADANIGVRARRPELYPALAAALSAERVGAHLAHLFGAGPPRVTRYTLPGVHALNFVLHDALGGGGIASLRFDAQGKAYAQQLLDLEVEVPRSALPMGA